MEELKIIMEALSKLGPAASTAFMYWCCKEVLVYSICPITFYVVGKIAMNIITIFFPRRDKENVPCINKEEEGDWEDW